jgi:hypothetical protein
VMDDFDAKLVRAANARAKAAETENLRLKARLAELQKEADAPAVPDSSEDDEASGAWEIGEDGKLRRVKKAADEKPADEQGCDKPKSSDDEVAASKATALQVINAHRKATGRPLVSRLVQDESIPRGVAIDYRDSEIFARAVIGVHRRVLNLPPLKAGEWISVKELRGEI